MFANTLALYAPSFAHQRGSWVALHPRPTAATVPDAPGDQLLSARNYAVTQAGTLAEALATLQSQPIDVVLLDVQLGEQKSGLQLLHTMRGDASIARVPVIILTGLRLDDADEEKIRSESAYVFYKPVDTEALLSYVARLNRGRSAS